MLEITKKICRWMLLPSILLSIQSCVQVKPYQRVFLNDVEMDAKARLIEFSELNAESYREGASGANGGKAGGGCGCN